MKTRKTKNIRLAACWMALGADYVGVDRTDKRHQEFTFSTLEDDVRELEDKTVKITRGVDLDIIETQLANRELMVNADDLFNAFQRMKSIIHSS